LAVRTARMSSNGMRCRRSVLAARIVDSISLAAPSA
jgi:hypothetical protein